MKSRVFSQLTVSVAVIVVGFTTYAQAGPPLICHAIEIGQAKSLPLLDWNRKDTAGYELKNLSRDTLAILDANAPVLVRMETIRRATIFARHDPQVAKELLTRVLARAEASDAGVPEVFAWFDAGYLIETYKQWIGTSERNPASRMDGYAWVKKAIGERGDDAEMQFAAALITLGGPQAVHRDHARRAVEGAKGDPLLAQNLASNFHGQAMSEL